MSTGHSETRNRLIVVIDDNLAGNLDLAHTLYWAAKKRELDVLYLVVVEKLEDELLISLKMATMNASTSDPLTSSNSRVIKTEDIILSIQKIIHAKDIIVCPMLPAKHPDFQKMQAIQMHIKDHFKENVFPLDDLCGNKRESHFTSALEQS